MWFIVAFLSVPVIEIALFILVGGWIGVLRTLLLVVLAVIVGVLLIRQQGQSAMASLRQGVLQDTDPSEAIVRGAMAVLAGMLFIIPGFLTDAVAIALLIPMVQKAAFAALRRRARMQGLVMSTTINGTSRPVTPQDRVIDAEFEEISPPKRPTHNPSGWTQH
jgi:UPF0716 protein FxsA